MAIPKFFEFFEPTLRALNKCSPMKTKELFEILAEDMQLSPEDRIELLPSGRQPTYVNRIHWSIQYLKNAGLLRNVARGSYEITALGKKALMEDAGKIDLHYLEQFDSFIKFHGTKPEKVLSGSSITTVSPDITPQESMENANSRIREELAKSLLVAIMESSPAFLNSW